MGFLEQWQNAATTTFGLFWMALWAFIVGYVVSSIIQVFVTHRYCTAYRAPVRLLHSDD